MTVQKKVLWNVIHRSYSGSTLIIPNSSPNPNLLNSDDRLSLFHDIGGNEYKNVEEVQFYDEGMDFQLAHPYSLYKILMEKGNV